MSIEKKSLISNRSVTKKAIVTKPTVTKAGAMKLAKAHVAPFRAVSTRVARIAPGRVANTFRIKT